MQIISQTIDRFLLKFGQLIAWAAIILLFVIVAQVVLRYGFSAGLVAIEELQWHLYAFIIMFGLSFSQTLDTHVRVDVMAQRFSAKTRAYIEIFGILILLFPFCYLLIEHGIYYAYDSFRVMEISASPGGLSYRWLIKSVIPISGFFIFLGGISSILKNIMIIKKEGIHVG